MSRLFMMAAWLSVVSAMQWHVLLTNAEAKTDRTHIAAICDSAALIASAESGVPVDVLRAISLTETGRKVQGRFLPWPWTVNMEGIGKWFDTVGEAQAYVDGHFARGARSFDVGCFQINFRWHGQAFDSIEDMFDPFTNGRYAARFLNELFQELGNWPAAAGAYHSRTPKFANKYKARFNRIRGNLTELPELVLAQAENQPTSRPGATRVNTFPFLQRQGVVGSSGSLVPLNIRGLRLIDINSARPMLEMR